MTYVAVTVTAANGLGSTFPATLQQSPLRYTTTVRQALAGAGLGGVEKMTSLDTANFTELRIELAAPAGQPIALRTRPEAVESQLVGLFLFVGFLPNEMPFFSSLLVPFFLFLPWFLPFFLSLAFFSFSLC